MRAGQKVTAAHVRAMWQRAPSLPTVGLPMGVDPQTGGPVSGDPVTWARAGMLPRRRVVVCGQADTLLQRWVVGSTALGVSPVVVDGGSRLTKTVAALGGQVIEIGRGADTFNPFDEPAHRLVLTSAMLLAATGAVPDVRDQRQLAAAIDTLNATWDQPQAPVLWDLIAVLQKTPGTAALVQTLQSIVHHYGDVIARPSTASINPLAPAVSIAISGVNPKDHFLRTLLHVAAWSATAPYLRERDSLAVIRPVEVMRSLPGMLDEVVDLLQASAALVMQVPDVADAQQTGCPACVLTQGGVYEVQLPHRTRLRATLQPTSTETDIAAGLVPAAQPGLWPEQELLAVDAAAKGDADGLLEHEASAENLAFEPDTALVAEADAALPEVCESSVDDDPDAAAADPPASEAAEQLHDTGQQEATPQPGQAAEPADATVEIDAEESPTALPEEQPHGCAPHEADPEPASSHDEDTSADVEQPVVPAAIEPAQAAEPADATAEIDPDGEESRTALPESQPHGSAAHEADPEPASGRDTHTCADFVPPASRPGQAAETADVTAGADLDAGESQTLAPAPEVARQWPEHGLSPAREQPEAAPDPQDDAPVAHSDASFQPVPAARLSQEHGDEHSHGDETGPPEPSTEAALQPDAPFADEPGAAFTVATDTRNPAEAQEYPANLATDWSTSDAPSPPTAQDISGVVAEQHSAAVEGEPTDADLLDHASAPEPDSATEHPDAPESAAHTTTGSIPETLPTDDEPASRSRRLTILLGTAAAVVVAVAGVWAQASGGRPPQATLNSSAGGQAAAEAQTPAQPGGALASGALPPTGSGGVLAAQRHAPAAEPGAGLVASGEAPPPSPGAGLIAASMAARPLPDFGVARVSWSKAASWQQAQVPVVTPLPVSVPGTTVTVPQYPQPANPQVAPPQSGQGSSNPTGGASGGGSQPAPGAPPPNQPFNPQNPDSAS